MLTEIDWGATIGCLPPVASEAPSQTTLAEAATVSEATGLALRLNSSEPGVCVAVTALKRVLPFA